MKQWRWPRLVLYWCDYPLNFSLFLQVPLGSKVKLAEKIPGYRAKSLLNLSVVATRQCVEEGAGAAALSYTVI